MMKNFNLAQPQTFLQASSLLARTEPGTYAIAGGTDLLDEIKNEILHPDLLVDLHSIPDTASIQREQHRFRIGALTTIASLAEDPLLGKEHPSLRQAALSLATPQIRNVGTVGGNLCQRPRCWYYRDPRILCRKKGGAKCYALRGRNQYHAVLGRGLCNIVHPSDLAPVLISLKAEAVIAGPKKDRTVPLENFFTLPSKNVRKENILNPGEILKEILVPRAKKGQKSTYMKFKERGSWDFAVVSAAVSAVPDGGILKDLRIVLGGVAPIPWRMEAAESRIQGQPVKESLVRTAFQAAFKPARALAENGYKIKLAETIATRAVLSLR